MAIINPTPKNLEELLSGKKYSVPVYQRSYSWGNDEIEELWNDINDNSAPYFLGIILLRQNGSDKTYEIVDGQQRLATLILLIRAAIQAIESAREKNKLERFVSSEEVGKSDLSFTLTLNYRDNDKFKTLLSDSHEYKLSQAFKIKRSASWKRLEDARTYFYDRLIRLGDDKKITDFIREKVLKIQLIDIHLQSDDDVYLFFETLNDRGIDLSLADLVKNRVCSIGVIPPYEAANRVDNIADSLGAGKMKPFLLHYSWALTEEKAPRPIKNLMDWYSDVIGNEKDLFLPKLEEFAAYYSELIEPKKIKSNYKNSLIFLKALGASRCYPLLLTGRKLLEPKDFERLCKAVELLTVRWSTIVQRDAKSLEIFYFNLAKKIKDGADISEIIEKIKNQSEDIPDDLFETHFLGFETKNLQIARYLLLKIDDHLTGGKSVGLDWDTLTLDHIIARKLSTDDAIDSRDKLGNMTLLSETNNKSLGNKPYPDKVAVYSKESRLILPRDLAKNYKEFTHESINMNQEYLTELALKVWNPNTLR